MNCEEVNNHLLEYLDKTLDTAMTTRIATHLISCANCGAEVGELTDCIEQVTALPMVDPPIGFAQRVMAHVRELEDKPTIWQRLFLPWGKKLPLQATALAMVGVIGIFLYQKDDQLKQSDPKNMTRSASVEPGNAANESKPAGAFPSDKKEKLAAQAPIEQAKRNESKAQNKPVVLPSSDQVATAKSEIEARLEENQATKRPPIQVQEVSNPREPGRFANDAIGFGGNFAPAGILQAAPKTALVPAGKFAVPLYERGADIEFVVRRHPAQRRDQLSPGNVDTLRKSSETDATLPAAPTGAPVGRAGSGASGSTVPSTAPIAEIRFYNVAPEHYEFFKKELASEAIIESESKPAAKEKEIAIADRQLLIKVTILPPAIPESSTPSR
jgi:hypothetical protein